LNLSQIAVNKEIGKEKLKRNRRKTRFPTTFLKLAHAEASLTWLKCRVSQHALGLIKHKIGKKKQVCTLLRSTTNETLI